MPESNDHVIDAEYLVIDDTRPLLSQLPVRAVPIDETIPSPRIPVLFLLDDSGSMSGSRSAKLTQVLGGLRNQIRNDPNLAFTVELSIVRFGTEAVVLQDFALQHQTSENIHLSGSSGGTSMGKALGLALDLLEARKRVYRDSGIKYYRPWLVLFTDGEATDSVEQSRVRVKEYIDRKKVIFLPFAIGAVGGVFTSLARLTDNMAANFNEDNWDKFADFIKTNLKSVSQSQPGDHVPLTGLEQMIRLANQ